MILDLRNVKGLMDEDLDLGHLNNTHKIMIRIHEVIYINRWIYMWKTR